VDAPGHEILMATMLSGAAVMDGAILVIAADERCPQPQTREHLAAIDTVGLKNIIIVQNKIDIVTREDAIHNYNEIQKFAEGSVAENAPIIPVSAQHDVNTDLLLQAMEEYLPTPERDQSKASRMYIVRSFDVNVPGTAPTREKNRVRMQGLYTEITSLHSGKSSVDEAMPGGLVGVGTYLDPSLTKSDGLVGSLLGKPETLPPVIGEMSLDVQLFDTVVGSREMQKVASIAKGERLLVNIGTAKSMGTVTKVSKNYLEASLTIPVCGEADDRVALSRRIGSRWRLIGVGTLKG
jgi:translation initiation factor 2 subunit 3